MAQTWILVADRSSARLIAVKSRTKLDVLETFGNPDGRLQDREIDTDKPGRNAESVGKARHSYEPRHSPSDTIANTFARELAEVLERGRTEHRFDKLILVANRKFLGRLRAELGKDTLRLITATLDKDLSGVADSDLADHLGDMLDPDVSAFS